MVRPGLSKLVLTSRREKESRKDSCAGVVGLNGQPEKSFEADAFHRAWDCFEVEAGRAVVNNQFLKDLFQAIVMHGVDYLVLRLGINTIR